MFFQKTVESYIRYGDKHIERVCDLTRGLERGELKKAIRDYSKALTLFLEEERKYGWQRHKTEAPHIRLELGPWPGKNFITFGQVSSLDQNAILARIALVYFIDGQYDKAIENTADFLYSGLSILATKEERKLLRGRVYAARGSCKVALTQYSELEKALPPIISNRTLELYGDVYIEKAVLQCRLGQFKEAQYVLEGYLWPRGPHSKPHGIKVFYIENFEEEAQRKSQDTLFPLNPKGTLDLILFIALTSQEVPPIIMIRKSVELANAAIKVALKVGAESKSAAGVLGRNFSYCIIPFLRGIMFPLKATSEQATNFIKQMRAYYDIEQLECFGLFSDRYESIWGPRF